MYRWGAKLSSLKVSNAASKSPNRWTAQLTKFLANIFVILVSMVIRWDALGTYYNLIHSIMEMAR